MIDFAFVVWIFMTVGIIACLMKIEKVVGENLELKSEIEKLKRQIGDDDFSN